MTNFCTFLFAQLELDVLRYSLCGDTNNLIELIRSRLDTIPTTDPTQRNKVYRVLVCHTIHATCNESLRLFVVGLTYLISVIVHFKRRGVSFFFFTFFFLSQFSLRLRTDNYISINFSFVERVLISRYSKTRV